MDYKNAGVDIEAGYKSVELMKEHVKKTMRPEVLGGLGGFYRMWKELSGKDRIDRKRCCRRMFAVRSSADRR